MIWMRVPQSAVTTHVTAMEEDEGGDMGDSVTISCISVSDVIFHNSEQLLVKH